MAFAALFLFRPCHPASLEISANPQIPVEKIYRFCYTDSKEMRHSCRYIFEEDTEGCVYMADDIEKQPESIPSQAGTQPVVEISEEMKEQISQQWEHLGICNDFIFCKVMLDEELLAELVRLILPDIRFTKLEVQAQKTVEEGLDIHGVRFDIFCTDETGRVIDIEMQVLDTGHLPKRLRFYGSMADMQMLDKGIVYSKLHERIIIMICPFDLYGKGFHRYTFANICKEDKDLEMGDETTNIVLNAVGTADDVEGTLKEFLDYVAGKQSDDPFVKKVDEAVRKARANKEWRREYMTLVMRDLENQELGLERGVEKEQRDRITVMLRDGKTPQDIADFCKYPIKLIQEVQQSMLATR